MPPSTTATRLREMFDLTHEVHGEASSFTLNFATTVHGAVTLLEYAVKDAFKAVCSAQTGRSRELILHESISGQGRSSTMR